MGAGRWHELCAGWLLVGQERQVLGVLGLILSPGRLGREGGGDEEARKEYEKGMCRNGGGAR